LITQFLGFHHVDPFRRYSGSKSKVVRNSAEFFTFFALPNFVQGTPSKSYTRVITATSRHVARLSFKRLLPLASKLQA